VAPYRKGGKNDGNDAEAICEAVARPRMRFVPVKSAEQQAILCLHRVRSALIKERTARINQLRGLLAEFGLIMPKGRYSAQHQIPDILEDAENGLPMLARRLLHDTYRRLNVLNDQVLIYDRELNQLARESEPAQRLMTVPGVGAITATALLASVGDPKQFKNGRKYRRLARLNPTAIYHRWRHPARAHHQEGRCLPSNPVDSRNPGSTGDRQGQTRQAQCVGPRRDRAARLQACRRGPGGQECPYPLGIDGPG
jgi:hypothetical protein